MCYLLEFNDIVKIYDQRFEEQKSKATKLIVSSTIAPSSVFEDNKGCVELAKVPRMRPRTHHIALKYHHFCSQVENGNISRSWIDTQHQLADIFYKTLSILFPIPLSCPFKLVTF